MNCLLCDYKSNNVDDINKHYYIIYHKINERNFFLQLFNNQNGLICKECLRCHEFLTTKLFMTKHNFLKHYLEGERKPAEYKPIDIIKRKDITLYQISYEKHSNEYDFFNSEEVVDDFLFNVKSIFKPSNNVIFKSDLSIENIQTAPLNSPDIADIKSFCYWSTDIYKGVYLNDFIISEIRNDILKRVINNNLSGSSWHFNRLQCLNLKVVEENQKLKIQYGRFYLLRS